jgi:alanine-glyoxylate transaminase/serine-glyoxylate transaminase/serine-pyruvate transaminase
MARAHKPRNYASDLKNSWVKNNYWGVDATRPQTFHSSYPILQLYSLRETLATLAEEGLDKVWLRHENCTKKLYAGLDELGLKYFVSDPESRLIGTVAMIPPNGVNPKELMGYIRQKYETFKNSSSYGSKLFDFLGTAWKSTLESGPLGIN